MRCAILHVERGVAWSPISTSDAVELPQLPWWHPLYSVKSMKDSEVVKGGVRISVHAYVIETKNGKSEPIRNSSGEIARTLIAFKSEEEEDYECNLYSST